MVLPPRRRTRLDVHLKEPLDRRLGTPERDVPGGKDTSSVPWHPPWEATERCNHPRPRGRGTLPVHLSDVHGTVPTPTETGVKELNYL